MHDCNQDTADNEDHNPPYSQRLAFSVDEVCKATGLGRNRIYKSIGSGDLKARRLAGPTLILSYSTL